MKCIFTFLACVGLAFAASASYGAEAGRSHVRALLVLASKERGDSDPRLAPYEANLRRILRFESYRLAGEGEANISTPGTAQILIGRGHSLSVATEKSEGRGLHLRVDWQADGRSLMNTGLSLRPGTPAVLGGPATGKEGEVFAVIVVAD